MKRKIEFVDGTLRKLVYNFIKNKTTFTVYDVYEKFPKENRNSLRGILSLFVTAGILKTRREYEVI